jgi:hypothetical protein
MAIIHDREEEMRQWQTELEPFSVGHYMKRKPKNNDEQTFFTSHLAIVESARIQRIRSILPASPCSLKQPL